MGQIFGPPAAALGFFTAGSFSPFNSQEVRKTKSSANSAERSILETLLRKGPRQHRPVAPPRGRSAAGAGGLLTANQPNL